MTIVTNDEDDYVLVFLLGPPLAHLVFLLTCWSLVAMLVEFVGMLTQPLHVHAVLQPASPLTHMQTVFLHPPLQAHLGLTSLLTGGT